MAFAMNAREADALGVRLTALLQEKRPVEAGALLAPILAERTPFRLLDRVGAALGGGSTSEMQAFLDRIASERTEGGWVIIASALREQLNHDPKGTFARCRHFISVAGVWYGADILGERVPGPALVIDFEAALVRLAPWRADEDRWVRRAAGVAVHFWAKRSQGAPELGTEAQALLAFLSPLFEEWEMDAAKGVGWGLKTLGRYYPDQVAAWLAEQGGRRPRAVVVRKALTHLSDRQRARATQG